MAVPVFVNEILCRDFSDGAKPLWAPRRHPDKIAGGHGIPRIAETIDAAAFEHQEAVLHDVHFDHAECGSRLVDHRVHGEIEMHRIGK